MIVSFSTADITAANAARGDDNLISLCVELLMLWSPLTAGVDYASTVISTLSFSRHPSNNIHIPILQDSLPEPTEQFHANLALGENNGISVIVDPAVATVNIIDDESELRF